MEYKTFTGAVMKYTLTTSCVHSSRRTLLVTPTAKSQSVPELLIGRYSIRTIVRLVALSMVHWLPDMGRSADDFDVHIVQFQVSATCSRRVEGDLRRDLFWEDSLLSTTF